MEVKLDTLESNLTREKREARLQSEKVDSLIADRDEKINSLNS